MSPQSTGDEEKLEDQSQRVLRLYERMVAVPMLGVESAWEKYTEICSMLGMQVGRKGQVQRVSASPLQMNPPPWLWKVQEHVRKAHEQAVQQAETYMETEQVLLDDENPAAKLAAYMPYAKVGWANRCR